MGFKIDLRDQVALVTGAGRNIGEEISKKLADQGANLIVVDIDENRVQSTASEIASSGGKVVEYVADVSDQRQIQGLADFVKSEFSGLDILINNAAVMDNTPFSELTIDEFNKVIQVNLVGPFLCTQKLSKVMADSGGGAIVNMASTLAHEGRVDNLSYSMSKNGIISMTRSMAKALSDQSIRVNAISPTLTGAYTLSPDEVSSDKHIEKDVPDTVAEDIPLQRWGQPEDIANTALFLVSEKSSFINGEEVIVDGGRSI